jgi:NAD(P)-dependent dehydrogenase (short-subunit alcohol dehydrogenase family)
MNILITGASSGIGKALFDHYKSKFISPTHNIVGVSRRGPTYGLDLLQEKDTAKLRGIINGGGDWDAVIFNAGILSFQEQKDWKAIYRLNFHSIWNCLENIISRKPCSIIINASLSGVTGEAEIPYYAALKAGLINMTKSFASRFVHHGVGVRVNCFSCGFFDTPLVSTEEEGPSDLQELLDKIPMRRMGQPCELIPVTDMLINCKYITGQNIIVDGGLSL